MIKFDDWMLEEINLTSLAISDIAEGICLYPPATYRDYCRIKDEHIKNEFSKKNNYLRVNNPKCIK